MRFPYQSNVSSPFGAPMGRKSGIFHEVKDAYEIWHEVEVPAEMALKLHLHRVPFVDGDYDQGGAYWGGGPDSLPLFCAWDSDGETTGTIYLRAREREDAKAQIKALYPNARFYR